MVRSVLKQNWGVDTVRSVAAAIPLILKYQGTGKIHAVEQEDDIDAQLFDLDGYFGSAVFGEGHVPHVPKDWRHFTPPPDEQTQGATGPDRGRGLVIQAGINEFYSLAPVTDYTCARKWLPEKRLDATFVTDHWQSKLAHQLKVDEGHFGQKR